MKKSIFGVCIIAINLLVFVACTKGDGLEIVPPDLPVEMADFELFVTTLDELEGEYIYEGWLIVDGDTISTGTFDGSESNYTFSTIKENLDKASRFVISIEPLNDIDPTPAATKILSGAFVDDRADLNLNEIADFSDASGNFEIFTPSDLDDTNEENGIWFVTSNLINGVPNGTYEAGLNLPTLAEGWKYEGWVVIDDFNVSTGTFIDPTTFDDSSLYSGNNPDVPFFPGEDFIVGGFPTQGSSALLTFPADGDLTFNKLVFISIEPVPDNDENEPFFVRPLVGFTGLDLSPAANELEMDGISLNVFGTVNR